MDSYTTLYAGLVSYWNDFAAANGYDPVITTNNTIRNVVKRRIRAEPDFLARLPYYFEIIQKHCEGKDEYGRPLTLHSALRSTTTLRALRAETGV